jgi:bifunctional non-homologous end joining protein LigD
MPPSATPSLQRYRAKRDFAKTPEPSGVPRKSGRRLEFVVQRHHARRLHYDFRLEWNGVLKSWAVPTGPSLDPAEKRLAVQVEDHPLAYRHFSGDIPAGEYGAGNVIIWDRGTWTPHGDVARGLRDGKIDFSLHGERLHGRWSLVRLRDDTQGKSNWLLIKQRDENAVTRGDGPAVTELHTEALDAPAPSAARTAGRRLRPSAATAPRGVSAKKGKTNVPRAAARRAVAAVRRSKRMEFIPPQLATAVDAFPAAGHWITELKFDGYRILVYADGERVHCFSRSGLDWTHRMPNVAQALARLGLQDTWLDGELVAVDENGVPQFQRLQQAMDPRSGNGTPVLMVFDVLQLEGADLRTRPLRERKSLLQQTLASLDRQGPVQLVEFVDDASPALRDRACAGGFEGVILKDADADYRSGRNRAWLKLKCRREQEFVIGGYTRTAAGRETLTALLLGFYEAGRLVFAGRAGTGFSEEQLGRLRKRLDALAQATSPFATPPKLRQAERPQWVRPTLVAQVRFAEWTDTGILRQPLFLGLREDKAASEVAREPDMAQATTKSRQATTSEPATPSRRRGAAARAPARSKPSVTLTNPQRVLFPTDGVTKQQLAKYYEAVAPVLWPHLRARPLSLVRATSSQGRVFFQRHIEGRSLPGLTPVEIPGSDEKPYFVCSTQDSIPLLAQMGAVELHTWGSRMPRPQLADRITFDLDPDPTLPWALVREAATLVRGMLTELGLEALLKTSGGMGLHLVVPLAKGAPMEVVAAFSRRIAEHLSRTIPERFSSKRGAANRRGLIYVDWQRNQFAATTVAAYSPRNRPGVPVSMPVDWDELGAKDIRGRHFNLRNVAARVAAQGDAWTALSHVSRTLTRKVIDRLERAAA